VDGVGGHGAPEGGPSREGSRVGRRRRLRRGDQQHGVRAARRRRGGATAGARTGPTRRRTVRAIGETEEEDGKEVDTDRHGEDGREDRAEGGGSPAARRRWFGTLATPPHLG